MIMIVTFGCKETALIGNGKLSRKLPGDIQERALRKLRQIDAALTLDDLRNPPGNHLEVLQSNKKGFLSIRINEQWRICFIWKNSNAYDVEIIDYH